MFRSGFNIEKSNGARAASELAALGITSRGSVRTRGSLRKSADNSFPFPEKISTIIECLKDPEVAVRCNAALALGEWGGEESAIELAKLLAKERNEEVRLHAITALRIIGGAAAARALATAAETGSARIRDATLTAIEELITGGAIDISEGPQGRQEQAIEPATQEPHVVRTRGAVRARGVVNNQELSAILDAAVQRIKQDPSTSEYLRRKAETIRSYLEK